AHRPLPTLPGRHWDPKRGPRAPSRLTSQNGIYRAARGKGPGQRRGLTRLARTAARRVRVGHALTGSTPAPVLPAPIPAAARLMTYRFFVVDDDKHYARLLSYRLEKDKAHEVHVFHTGEAALDGLDAHAPDLALLDIMMPGIGGMETLRRLKLLRPELPVVMISAQGTVDVAVECMRGGADDYITKGQDDLIKLDAVVKRYRERIKLSREVEALRGEVAEKYGLEEIIGDSPAMEGVYRLIQKTLRGNLTVAIQGESGTGKELVARAIHFNTKPRGTRGEGARGETPEGPGPFVVVNCAAIPKELMESEFFGHE